MIVCTNIPQWVRRNAVQRFLDADEPLYSQRVAEGTRCRCSPGRRRKVLERSLCSIF